MDGARIPWPQGTPVDVDPERALAEQTPRMCIATVATSAALVAFGTSAVGQRWLAISPGALVGTAGLHAAFFAFNTFVLGRERYVLPRFWPVRALALATTTMAAAVYGAGSAADASAGHGVLLAAAPIFAGVAPGSPVVAVTLLVVPVLVRLVAVPGASPTSFAVTWLMGAVAAVLYWGASRPAARILELQSAANATRELARAAHERTATLSVAMSLHDGLSGLLFAATRRLAAAKDARDAQAIAAEVLLRASRVVAPSHRGELVTPDGIQASLESLAAALGLAARVRVEHRGAAWDDAELREVLDIATEMLANGAKHAPACAMALSARLTDDGFRLVCGTGAGGACAEHRGRGLRNVELRAASRGGRSGVERRDGCVGFVVEWPRATATARDAASPVARRLLVEIAVIALAIAPLSTGGSPWGGVIVTSVACALTVMMKRERERMVLRERERLDQARAALHAAEGEGVLRLVDDACGPSLAALERAARDGSVPGMREAVAALSGVVSDLLWALEWSGDAEALEADLRDFARRMGAPPPTDADLAATVTPSARYAIRRRLRDGAHAR